MNTEDTIWRKSLLTESATIKDAVKNLEGSAIRIVLVVDERGSLVGTVTDGDIRRGLLRGLSLSSPLNLVIHRNALVVPPHFAREAVIRIMQANKVQQIPVVDDRHHVLGLHLWDQVAAPLVRSNFMIIMAGGKGTRLHPITENCPKPMVKLAGKPMLQHIIERSKSEGFTNFVLAIHHLGHMIEEYFGSGEKMNVKINYLRENSPLGTAGALSLLNPVPTAPIIVTNADVITDIRYGDLLDFHINQNADATMAVREHEWQHPFGVVHTKGLDIIGFEEKPIARSHINAGVYALSPSVFSELIENEVCDMPDLFERLKAQGRRIIAYPMHEPWLDVGRPDDLNAANISYTNKL